MKKLIRGIVDFRRNIRPGWAETFRQLALGQRPDSLFIACSDSRVVPNLFASSDPGDLFVIRNVGNMIAPCGTAGHSVGDEAEAAAIEFALLNLPVMDIIVCGHSECGAMEAIVRGRMGIRAPNLRNWLRHGEPAMERLRHSGGPDQAISECNQLSQLNVLHQIENLKTYPLVKRRLAEGSLRIHGWWFDIGRAEVLYHDEKAGRFVLIDEKALATIDR